MADLTVVDLGSQAEAVAAFVRGWTKTGFLTWLSQFGEIIKVPDADENERYSFQSSAGVWTGFWFTKSGELKLLGTSAGITRLVSVPLEGGPVF